MSDQRLDSLSRELRRWAERPGTLSAAAARTRVLAGLPHRRRRPLWRLATAGAVVAAAALAVVLVVGRRGEPIATPSPEPPPAPAAEGDQRLILHQLSSGTKLYIVMRPETANNEL